MGKQFRVALLIESSRTFGRQLLRGIAAFGRERGDWVFLHEERSLSDQAPLRLRQWRPDGILARPVSPTLTAQLRRMRVPVVDLYHEEETPGIPSVMVDQEAIAQMAISHFLDRGFRNFAYCGFAGVRFSELREKAFARLLGERGNTLHVFEYPALRGEHNLAAIEAHALRYSAALAQWLAALPKPVGLFACNDVRGQQILASCSELGIAVPGEVAVLGVDNDDVQCEFSAPSLSSIDPNAETMGYEAARLLQRLFDDRPDSLQRVWTMPSGVVARRSTDVLAIADPDIAEAVRFVRQRACDGSTLRAIVAGLPVSRSTLERWFRRVLGHSLANEVLRVRVERCAALLADSALTVERIAHLSGFAHVETMSRVFRRVKGVAPGQYRLQIRTKGDSHQN